MKKPSNSPCRPSLRSAGPTRAASVARIARHQQLGASCLLALTLILPSACSAPDDSAGDRSVEWSDGPNEGMANPGASSSGGSSSSGGGGSGDDGDVAGGIDAEVNENLGPVQDPDGDVAGGIDAMVNDQLGQADKTSGSLQHDNQQNNSGSSSGGASSGGSSGGSGATYRSTLGVGGLTAGHCGSVHDGPGNWAGDPISCGCTPSADGNCRFELHWEVTPGLAKITVYENGRAGSVLSDGVARGQIPVTVPYRGATYEIWARSFTPDRVWGKIVVKPLFHPEGQIDRIDHDGEVTGWVRDKGRPERSLVVDMYVDGQKQAAVWAKHSRPEQAFDGHDKFGFVYHIPDRFFDGNDHTLLAKVVDNDGQQDLELRTPFNIDAGAGQEPQCTEDADCGEGRVCQAGRCVLAAQAPFDPAKDCRFDPGATLGVSTDANLPTIPLGVFKIGHALFFSNGGQWCYFGCWEGHQACFKESILDPQSLTWEQYQQRGSGYLGDDFQSLPASMGCGVPCGS